MLEFRSQVEIMKATREPPFSIQAGAIPMFGLIPFPADRLTDRAVAEEQRPAASSKIGPKRIAGQGEMLVPIPGKKGDSLQRDGKVATFLAVALFV